MNSTLQRINLINDRLLTIGLLPTSYLVSMTYEEQLLWLCNYLEKTLLPKMNELIETFNGDTAIIEEAINNIIDLTEELKQDMIDLENDVDNKLDKFMDDLADNLNTIANEILTQKIQNGELIVSLGINYDEDTEELEFSIDSQSSLEVLETLETLTTPEESEG